MVRKSSTKYGVVRAQIGKLIRTHRKARKLRLIDMAQRTGFSLPKLCRIEYGNERLGYAELAQLANALQTTVPALLPKRGVKIARVLKLDFGGGDVS